MGTAERFAPLYLFSAGRKDMALIYMGQHCAVWRSNSRYLSL
nr:MAG TPA: hypothetical protein [Caudoviricetes sp.]